MALAKPEGNLSWSTNLASDVPKAGEEKEKEKERDLRDRVMKDSV